MPERIRELRNFQLRYFCDEAPCDGEMRFTNEPPMQIAGSQPLFKHVCSKCRNVKFHGGVYPISLALPVNEAIPDAWNPLLERDQIINPPPPLEEKKVVLSS